MILVTPGVVLSRRRHREFDRVTYVYTKALGKVAMRFSGVDRPRGKLKGLSEPMIHAEYRLYMRQGSPWLTVTGGHILESYPQARTDLDRTLTGLEMCEILLRLTPEGSPNPEKYELITEHLGALDQFPSPWLALSFGFQLLTLAGLGPDSSRVLREDLPMCGFLQDADPATLHRLPEDPDRRRRLRLVLERNLERQMEAPLNSRLFRESIGVRMPGAESPVLDVEMRPV